MFKLSEDQEQIIEYIRNEFFERLSEKMVEEFNKKPDYWMSKINQENTDNGKA